METPANEAHEHAGVLRRHMANMFPLLDDVYDDPGEPFCGHMGSDDAMERFTVLALPRARRLLQASAPDPQRLLRALPNDTWTDAIRSTLEEVRAAADSFEAVLTQGFSPVYLNMANEVHTHNINLAKAAILKEHCEDNAKETWSLNFNRCVTRNTPETYDWDEPFDSDAYVDRVWQFLDEITSGGSD